MMRVDYVTPKPPLYEVGEFPWYVNRDSITEFLEWSGFSKSRKTPYQQEWSLSSDGYNSDVHRVKPGDKFYRPAGDPDRFHPAKAYHSCHAEHMQDAGYSQAVYEIGYDTDD